MSGYKPIAALMAVACAALAQPARADDDAAALRAELDSLKSDYDARVAALEARIAALESAPSAPSRGRAGRGGRRRPRRAASSASAFNPAISLVLAGSYADTSRDPEDWRVAGFMPNGGEIGPGERSFSLGESEMTLAASVDPYFTASSRRRSPARTRSRWRRRFSARSRCRRASPRKAGASSPASATSTKCTRTPGTSRTSRWSTRHSSATSARRTACSSSGSRRPTSSSSSAPRPATATRSPGTREQGNGLNGTTLFAHVGGDLGDTASWRAGASWIDLRADGREYEDVDATGRAGRQRVHGRFAHLGGRRGLQVGAGRQFRAALPEDPGRVHGAPRDAVSWRSTWRMPRSSTRTAARSPAGTCRASTSSRRAGARGCATTRSIPATPRSGS